MTNNKNEESWQDYVDSLIDEGELSITEMLFVNEFIANNYNATSAYTAVYGQKSEKISSAESCRMLKRQHVSKAIKKAVALKMKEQRATRDAITAKFTDIAFSTPPELFNEDGSTKKHRHLERKITTVHGEGDKHASYVETEINVKEIIAANRELAKIRKLFTEKKEIEGTLNVDMEGAYEDSVKALADAIKSVGGNSLIDSSDSVDDEAEGISLEEDGE